ncbi:Hypothetical predicted protein [Paramuricea clavata]|uniref:Uncharacterized protein n=1 Tax=Paramuricea clavata TaxID=317549 RepID=A0A7D9I7M3_PARCT|nr:Hypothetical predicted protein [Paramuricea clavata]
MAKAAPFALRFVNDCSSLRQSTDDTEPLALATDKERHRSSDVESNKNASKPRKNRQSKSDSTTPSTSEAKSTSSSRKRRLKPRAARIEIPVNRKYGSCEEEEPLLPKDEGNSNLDEVIVNIPIKQDGSANSKSKASSTQRFCSVFIVFLLPLIAGLTLIISVHIKSDGAARDINPAVFHYYIIGLIAVFILWTLWLVFKHLRNSNHRTRNKAFEPLMPSHLLNGLVLFGVCNTAFQVIVVLDWTKCSRSVSGLDKSYLATAIFETLFVYIQIYVFYTLSRRREQKLWFGNYFTMFTLAINLTLWAGYFCAGAVKHPDMKNVTWLRRYYYGKNEDLCASSLNNTGNSSESRKLHEFVKGMVPYQYTFAMEYSLLASALLLHVWLEIETPSAGEFGAANKKWDVWRFGFIAGLLSLPLMGCVGVYSTVEYSHTNAAFLYSVQAVLLFIIFVCSVGGLWLFRKHYKRVTDTKPLQVDLILLCSSALGFLILDLFTIFASVAETLKSYRGEMFMLGLTSLGELVTISCLTAFVFASYFYQMPLLLSKNGDKAVKAIRQIASFCITVSVGFWVIRTYTFRSKYYFDYVGRTYFGSMAWFAITLFSTPMCIFYHFHCAVCLSGMIADSTGVQQAAARGRTMT